MGDKKREGNKKEKKREKKREEEGKKRAHMAVRGVLVQWEVVPQAKLAAGVAMLKKKLISLVYKNRAGLSVFLVTARAPARSVTLTRQLGEREFSEHSHKYK